MTKSKTSLAPFDTQKMVAPVEMFKTQSVRDLFHVIASPHLLRPNGYLPLVDDSFTASLFSFVSDEDAFVFDSADDTAKQGKQDLQENRHKNYSSSRVLAWLQKLDATDNAAHLIEFLKTEKHHVRLGYYFSLLLEYFFRHCPVVFRSCRARVDFAGGNGFSSRRSSCEEDDAPGGGGGGGGRSRAEGTIDHPRSEHEEKLLENRDRDIDGQKSSVQARFVLEVESESRKNDFWEEDEEASKTRLWHVESAIHCSIAPEQATERGVLAARSNGAFLYESLLWRLLEYKQRIMKVQEAWRMMKSSGNKYRSVSCDLESKLLLRGWIFWPLSEWMAPRTCTGGPAGGGRAEFLSDAATSFRDSSQKSLFHRDPTSSSPSSSSPLHRFSSTCGFWTKEPEKDLRRVKIVVTDGEQEALTVTHWVLLLHKRYWLSPCVAWSDQLAGDPRIDLGPLPVHGLDDALQAVRDYQKANPRNPLFLSGLRYTNTNTTTGLYIYKECCRGVVLPRKWDTQHCRGVSGGMSMSSIRLEDCDSLASIQDYLGRTVLKDENLRQQRPVAAVLSEEGEKILRQSRAVVASAAAVLWMPAEPTERLASTDLFGPHSAAAPASDSVKGCVGERTEDYADYAVGVALGDVMARMTQMHLPRANTPGAVVPGGNEQKRVRATQQQELLQATTFYFASVEREKLLRAETALFKMLAALEQVGPDQEIRGSWSKIDVGYLLCDALARWKRMQGKHPKWAAHLQKAFEPPCPDSVRAQNTFTAMLQRSLAETLQELRRAATSSCNTAPPPAPAAGEESLARRSLPLKVLVKAGRVVQTLDFATALNVHLPGEETASRGNRKERKEEDDPFEVQAMLDLKNDVEALIDPEASSTPAAGAILNINRTKLHLEGLRNLLHQMSGSTQDGEQAATAGGDRNSAGKYNMAMAQHHGRDRERRSAGGNYTNRPIAVNFFCLPETVRVVDCDPSMSREDFWARVVGLQEMSSDEGGPCGMSSHAKQHSGPRIAIDCEWGGTGGRSARGGSELDDRSPDDPDLRDHHALGVEQSIALEASFNPEGVALAQVAISLHEVVLYDFTQRSHRQAFRRQILQNAWGRVVTYAFHNDLRKLQTSFLIAGAEVDGELSEVGDALWDLQEKIVDLQQGKIARWLQGKPKPGLAVVVEMLLGRPLDKSAQRSDWVRRPLTTAQRNYAALDAYVLLLLDDELGGATTNFIGRIFSNQQCCAG